MEQTLLLNATYEPLKVVHWQKAITLLCQGKVEVISVYDREIRGVTLTFRLPSVIRLLRYVRIRTRFDYVPFSRANIYARDDHTCQYCGERTPTSDLTFDHVVPVAQGGRKDWENIVACCVTCNRKKGGRTPAQAGMRLIRHGEASRGHACAAYHHRAAAIRRRAGGTTSTGTSNSTMSSAPSGRVPRKERGATQPLSVAPALGGRRGARDAARPPVRRARADAARRCPWAASMRAS